MRALRFLSGLIAMLLRRMRPATTRKSVMCVQCGRAVEEVRECYAIPTCYACLSPPEPLTPVSERQEEPRDLCQMCGENETAEAECGNEAFGSFCHRCGKRLCWGCTLEGYCVGCYSKPIDGASCHRCEKELSPSNMFEGYCTNCYAKSLGGVN